MLNFVPPNSSSHYGLFGAHNIHNIVFSGPYYVCCSLFWAYGMHDDVIRLRFTNLSLKKYNYPDSLNFCRTKRSRMAANPQKLQKFSPTKIKVHTVYQ